VTNRDPYRDERASLAEENARLRAEVDQLKGTRRRRGVLFVVGAAVLTVDLVAAQYVPAMINARDDTRVALGALVVVLLVAAHIVIALRVLPVGRRSE
jgi:hypothetical protein